MEEMRENENPEQEQPQGYTPRPVWQVWAARVGLVIFLLVVAYQVLSIATGGR